MWTIPCKKYFEQLITIEAKMQPTLKYYGIKQSIYSLTATCAANEAAAWLGRYIVAAHLPDLAILSINLFQGAGFGLATKAGAILATPVLSKVIENDTILSIASTIFGGPALWCDLAAAALGLTAAPLSIPAAISLTVVSIAIAILFPADKSGAAAKNETKEKADALEKEKAQLKKDQRQLAADLEQLRTYRASLADKEKNLREDKNPSLGKKRP